ncbi:MAG: N-acetylmuramoyl-L-alanine amidase [Chlorobium sp.]|nr:MAG: N-acetylmuramoyl-L-alanine amidase [Chlorobium sp.]
MRHLLFRIRSSLAGLTLLILLVCLCGTLFAVPPVKPAESTVPFVVSTGNDQGYTVRVLAMNSGKELLVDIESMARALRQSYRKNPEGIVLESSEGKSAPLCAILIGNNFARIVSRGTDVPERVIQMQSAPVKKQTQIYLSVTSACRLFTLWLDRNVEYNAVSGRISASTKSNRSGASVATIGSGRHGEPGTPAASTSQVAAERTVITGIEVEKRANGAILSFIASGPPVQGSLLKPDADGKAVLTLEKASCDVGTLSKIYNSGIVRAITPKQFEGAGLQFTVAFDNRSFVINSVDFQQDKKNNRYMLYVRSYADVEKIHRKEKEQQIAQVLNRDVEKWKLDTIVLDAGHGGKDPGAIGGNGIREKDVVLNIVRDLGQFIEQKWPDVRVIYTRKDDTFIPLHERGKIANRNGGKLFISVHCNASPNRAASGSEVYILGANKNKSALDVAMFENSVIRKEADYQLEYKGFTEEYLIMSSMAQNAFAKQSTTLAQDILKPVEMRQTNSSRGVRQASFMVLWTPSMPSTLVEVGYLSNPEEEKHLQDRDEQAKIAYGIFQGVQNFRKNYETSTMASMSN